MLSVCCGTQNNPFFERTKHMLNWMDKKIFTRTSLYKQTKQKENVKGNNCKYKSSYSIIPLLCILLSSDPYGKTSVRR